MNARVKAENNLVWHQGKITRQMREQKNQHKTCVLWFTGLSGAGKSTLAHAVEEHLHQLGCHTFVLDGDNIRHSLSADLGFSEACRKENIRRVGTVAKLMVEAGLITLATFINPFRDDRTNVRKLFPEGDFLEIYCKASLAICELRDVKGFYKKARAGEIKNFTGIDSPYEEPLVPDLVVDTEKNDLAVSVKKVLFLLEKHGVLELNHV